MDIVFNSLLLAEVCLFEVVHTIVYNPSDSGHLTT